MGINLLHLYGLRVPFFFRQLAALTQDIAAVWNVVSRFGTQGYLGSCIAAVDGTALDAGIILHLDSSAHVSWR